MSRRRRGALDRGAQAAGRGARAIGRGIAYLSDRAATAYWTHKEKIDPIIITLGATAIATSAVSDATSLSSLETLVAAGVGAAGMEAADHTISAPQGWLSKQNAKVAGLYAAAYCALVTATTAGIAIYDQETLEGAFTIAPGVALAAAAGHVAAKTLPAIYRGIRRANSDARHGGPRDPERREFLKTASTILAGGVTAAALETTGVINLIPDSIERLTAEDDPIQRVKYRGEEMVEVLPIDGEGYFQLSRELTGSAESVTELEKLNGPLLKGKAVYVPTRLLKQEFRDLEDSVIDYLTPKRPALWSIAEDYTVPPDGSDGRGARINSNIRIIQRFNRIADPREISAERAIAIPKGLVKAENIDSIKKEFPEAVEEEVPEAEEEAPPATAGDLRIDRRYFNARAQRPRRRPIGRKAGRIVFEDEARDIDMIVLHTTETPRGGSESGVLKYMQRKQSANYSVGRDGTVYMLVDPRFTANHAGESLWKGTRGLSYNSIGIEIVAKIEGEKQQEVTRAQYDSLAKLVSTLRGQYGIGEEMVLGHNQVAFSEAYKTRGRKGDPGLNFRWKATGLPDNYEIVDPDILAGRVRRNPDRVAERRMTDGMREAYRRRG